MIFELLLSVEIASRSATKSRMRCIDNLREQIDAQMRRVWMASPLRQVDETKRFRERANSKDGMSVVRKVGGTRFIPLICEELQLAADLQVTFYEPTGSLGVAGDVADADNRLKTLFDALRAPHSTDEMGRHDYGEECYTLLSDDRLIWAVRVNRVRLLREIDGSKQFTRVVVQLIPTSSSFNNISLLNVVVH